MELLLTDDQINEYKRTGLLVIENVLTEEEVEKARKGLHDQLLSFGIDHDKILSGEQTINEGTRLKSTASKIYYSKWKMDVHLNENVYKYMKQIMNATYFSGKTKSFEHPFGFSDDILACIDRVCWRLPDIIRSEGGLELHLDRNPFDPYLKNGEGLNRWRPIQAFVTLTDSYGSESGGLRVVKGFHHEIDSYFKKSKPATETKGEFYRLNSLSHVSLAKKLEPIMVPKGSLVCWDNRLPHATCMKLAGYDTREVVYVGWLPNVELNKKYVAEQLVGIKSNKPPESYLSDKDWKEDDLTELQRKLLGMY